MLTEKHEGQLLGGPVVGAKRWHRWPRRAHDPLANPEEVAQLLEDVRQLRLTLTADLAAAASAVEADELAVARDIVDADALEVRQLRGRARANRPQQPAATPRRRRALLALPAIPLVGALAMTGAAAFGGGGDSHRTTPVSSHHAIAPATHRTPSDIRQTATSTLRLLKRVVNRHPGGSQVVTVASHLHHQISALLAGSPHSASSLGEVQRLLAIEQQLLAGHHGHAASVALAASRELTQRLHLQTLPAATPTALPTLVPTPSHSPSPKPTTSPKKSPTPKTTPSTSAPTNPFPTPQSTHKSRKHHRHHHHLKNQLLGPGWFTDAI
jgi:hypothetical protein